MSDLFSEDENDTEDKHHDYTGIEIFTSSDPNFWDYVRLKDFTKKTGVEKKHCHGFCIKELNDNAGDFIEKYRYSNAIVIVEITNDKKKGIMTISVSNSNFGNIAVFGNLEQIFNYKRSYSSKSNQYRVARGAQGNAIKEFGTMGYILINSEDGEEENKPWDYPIIFQHNRKIEKVYINVDRKNREIIPRFEQSGTCDSTDTKVTITLPAVTDKEYNRLKTFCYEYAYLIHTYHITFTSTASLMQSCKPYTQYQNIMRTRTVSIAIARQISGIFLAIYMRKTFPYMRR